MFDFGVLHINLSLKHFFSDKVVMNLHMFSPCVENWILRQVDYWLIIIVQNNCIAY